jgi:hypothetical protein
MGSFGSLVLCELKLDLEFYCSFSGDADSFT